MRDVVRAAFPSFTDKFEGKLSFMYLDVLGLVTTGRGNLIDPMPAALVLPWKQALTGGLATRDQVVQEWNRVKGLQGIRLHGGGVFGKLTVLRLSPQDIDDLTFSKLDEMWAHLLGRFPDLEDWPADAQLALVSMAWAMGPAFRFPVFESCAHVRDWAGAARECGMNAIGNPGLIPRNAANRTLFMNAALGADPAVLS